MWSSVPVVTCSDAVPVLPLFVPVTVCAPAIDAWQMAALLPVPLGLIVNVGVDLTSPSEFPKRSHPSAVYDWPVVVLTVAAAGDTSRWSRAAAGTVSVAAAVRPMNEAVTVCAPAVLAVQTFRVHDPSGAIAYEVEVVMSPNELPAASKPPEVKVCDVPATI